MITKIIVNNLYKRIKEFNVSVSQKLFDYKATLSELKELRDSIEIIKFIQNVFKNEIDIKIPSQYYSFSEESKESSIEIQMIWNEKTYTYLLVFGDSTIYMETLLEGKSWIFSKLIDNPDFAFNPSYLNEMGKKFYKISKKIPSMSLLFCFNPGEELLNEIKSIIIIDDWWNIPYHQEFVKRFETTFPDLSYNKLINEMIDKFGFSSEYEKLSEDNNSLLSSIKSDITINILDSGSGFIWLSRIYPLMVASKKENLPTISSIPYDFCLHPILGKKLMTWFLEDNNNLIIGKLSNILLENI